MAESSYRSNCGIAISGDLPRSHRRCDPVVVVVLVVVIVIENSGEETDYDYEDDDEDDSDKAPGRPVIKV